VVIVSILDNGTESPLAIAIDMDELGDNETKEAKWCDIWLVAPKSMIHLLEDIFGDDVPWDCKSMLAYGWKTSIISSTNNKWSHTSFAVSYFVKWVPIKCVTELLSQVIILELSTSHTSKVVT